MLFSENGFFSRITLIGHIIDRKWKNIRKINKTAEAALCLIIKVQTEGEFFLQGRIDLPVKLIVFLILRHFLRVGAYTLSVRKYSTAGLLN